MAGSIVSGIIQGNANKSANRAQQHAATQATNVQERMYNQSREDLAPFREGGIGANRQLSYLLGINLPNDVDENGNEVDAYADINKDIGEFGSLSKRFTLDDYEADPGYQFRLDETNKALEQGAAAKGRNFSGAALKEAMRFGSDLASQEYGNSYNRFNNDMNTLYNRFAGLNNTGIGATNTGVQSNVQNANAMGNIYGQAGNAKANYRIAQGNIYGDMANNGVKAVSSFFMPTPGGF